MMNLSTHGQYFPPKISICSHIFLEEDEGSRSEPESENKYIGKYLTACCSRRKEWFQEMKGKTA